MLGKNQTGWTENFYPDELSSKTVNHDVDKIKTGSKDQLKIKLKKYEKTRLDLMN